MADAGSASLNRGRVQVWGNPKFDKENIWVFFLTFLPCLVTPSLPPPKASSVSPPCYGLRGQLEANSRPTRGILRVISRKPI